MNLTAREIADRLGAELIGDPTVVISRVAPLSEATPDAISWLGGEKYLAQLALTRAGAVLLPERRSDAPDRTCIIVADPDLALCSVLTWLMPPPPGVSAGVDPRAIIAPGARVEGAAIGPNVIVATGAVIGAGTQLHAGVNIGPDVRIGRDCVLWPNVVVRERCTIGDRVIIHPNATIGADGFGYLQRGGKNHKIPQVGVVVIEDDVEIGANSAIDRAKSGETRIGRGTKIDNLVQIAHNVQIGNDSIIVAQCGIGGSVTLGHHVVLAGQVGIVDHMRVGDEVIVGAQSGITRDVESGGRVSGSPAVPSAEWVRTMATQRRLREMLDQLRDLIRRVERLESATND